MGGERARAGDGRVGRAAAAHRARVHWRWSRPAFGCRASRWRGRSPSRILCAAALADSCGDEPALIAAYGSEVGELIVRDDMPSLVFEHGSRAVPVDFRSCRDTGCGDGPDGGLVAPHRHRPAGHRLRPRHRLPRGRRRPAGARTAPATAPATSTSSTGPTTPTRRPCAASRSPGRAATTATTGRRSSSASAPTATSPSAPPPTTATTAPRASPTAPPTPASGRCATSPRRSAPGRTAAGARPAGSCSSPAAATRATPWRSRRSTGSHRAIGSTSSRSSRSPPNPAPVRDQPALAQARLARPGGRGHGLSCDRGDRIQPAVRG